MDFMFISSEVFHQFIWMLFGGESGRRVCKITQSAVRFEVIYDVCEAVMIAEYRQSCLIWIIMTYEWDLGARREEI